MKFTGANIPGAAAAQLTRDLSKLFRSLDEQYPYAHVESDTQAESSQREMTASLALLKLQIVICTRENGSIGAAHEHVRGASRKACP
jgi:hypothetical protein